MTVSVCEGVGWKHKNRERHLSHRVRFSFLYASLVVKTCEFFFFFFWETHLWVKKTFRFGFHAISQYFSFDFGAQRLNLSFFQTIIFYFFSLELISQNKILVLSFINIYIYIYLSWFLVFVWSSYLDTCIWKKICKS